MGWVYLIAAGIFEMAGFIGLQRTSKRETWFNYLLMLGAFIVSISLLSLAIETIPLGTAYAVWAGIGTLGAAVLGILLYKEPVSKTRVIAIAGIILTVVALRLTG